MMNLHFINIIESSVTLAFLYLIYEFFLKKETFFKMNRLYLITSLFFAVTIPFLDFSINFFNQPEVTSNLIQKISGYQQVYNELGAVIVYANKGKFDWNIIVELLKLIYFTGVLISLSFFVFGLIKIIVLILSNKSQKLGKYEIVETSESVFPFSLFKWIIINPEKYSSDDVKQIIAHEKSHVFQLHSFDLIFIEVLVILFWFNPFIYWYRKSIREVHEYLADQAVVENGFDQIDYQKLLLSQAAGSRFVGLTSRFSYSLSKNRLKMLTMMKSKNISKIKIALAIPFIAVTVILFANPVESANRGELQNKNVFVEIQDTTNKKNESTEIIDGNGNVIVNKDGVNELVYFSAEVMPKFQGKSSDEFRFFIQKNLRYPKEAKLDSIEGRVFVQFDIDKDGNLTNAKVVRGVHSSLDNEALRVTNISPKWEPAFEKGKAVRTRFTFPIVFKLN